MLIYGRFQSIFYSIIYGYSSYFFCVGYSSYFFSVYVCPSQTDLKMASFYLPERASKRGRQLFKVLKRRFLIDPNSE